MRLSIIVACFVIAGCLCAVLSFVCFLRRSVPGARSFGFIMLASVVYAMGSAFELSGGSLERILLSVKVEYVGIVFLAPLWLLFAIEFSERELPPKGLLVLLFAEPLVVLALLWTTEAHGLFYSDYWIKADAPFPLIGLKHGIAYWIHTAIVWILAAAGFSILAHDAATSPAQARSSAFLSVIGMLIYLAANVMLILGATPYGIDLGPFGAAVAGIVFAFALMNKRFLVLLPVAREFVIESLEEGIVILDTAGKVVDFNLAAAALLGLDPGFGRADMDASLAQPELASLLAEGEGSRDLDGPLSPEGLRKRIKAKTFAVRDARRRPIGACILLSDITETALLVDKLAELASIDGLTGALNRRRLEEIGERDIELARRSGENLGVLMVDIDFFKLVNDEWGHAAGDAVLKEICVRCKSELRVSDSFGRIGGEEFAVILPSSDASCAAGAGERLRAAVASTPILWEGCGISVTVSVGAFDGIPAEGDTLSLFLRRADKALYMAKLSGRNRVLSFDEIE